MRSVRIIALVLGILVAACANTTTTDTTATAPPASDTTTTAPTSQPPSEQSTTAPGVTLATTPEPQVQPGFPKACQAWNGIQNRPDLSELERIASHDLMWSGTWDLGLSWEISQEQPYRGLSVSLTDTNGDSDLSAAAEIRASLQQLNPNLKTLVAILYREGEYVDDESTAEWWHYGHLPPDSPMWIRDVDGGLVPGWGEDSDKDGVLESAEILSSLIDFRQPELIELIAQKAYALQQTGLVDGIFLDWWNEHDRTAASYLDWSTFYMTADEEIDARLAILRRIRELVGDDFLILVNTNQLTAPLSAPYINGTFMEVWKEDYSTGYTVEELETVEETLFWASETLQEPRINCLEGWRVVYDYGNEDAQVAERNSPENRQWMRVFTTLALTHSEGHVLFGDDNAEPTWDHHHNWYEFWDADLGQPVGQKRQLLDGIEGLFIREYTNGYAVYNRSGKAHTIALPTQFTAVSTGVVGLAHELANLDGEIYLGPIPEAAAPPTAATP